MEDLVGRMPGTAAAVLTSLAVLGTSACGGGADVGRASAGTPGARAAGVPVGAEATRTPAVELRAGFTYLLTEHVHLAAAATGAALASSGQLTAPALTQALSALDANAVALSGLVGELYPKGKGPFLVAWRQRDGLLVDQALAAAAHDPRRGLRARQALEAFDTSFGQLLGSLAPPLPPTTVADDLGLDVSAQLQVTDAQVAHSPSQFALLRVAAGRMPATAALLSRGMARDRGLGDADTAAGDLRAGLTALLVSHVYVVAAQVEAAASGATLRSSATAATDEVSRGLSRLLGAGYPALAGPFLSSWRRQVADLVDYGVAGRRHDLPAQSLALVRLDEDHTRLGALVHAAVPQLPAATLAEELRPQAAALLVALDNADQASPDAAAALTAAAGHMPSAAEVLAGGVAEDRSLH